ncbi:MAG: hypothetical protein WCW27_05845 [Patescibacteria group bacterium]
MHLSRKSSSTITLYLVQSLIVAVLLFSSALQQPSWLPLFIAVLVFVLKVIVAPQFFYRLIREHQITFSASTYLNAPVTLIIIAMLTAFTYSDLFKPLTVLTEQNVDMLPLAIAMLLISVFLVINRKGALSQMIGILSLENAIVSFAFLAGLEQAPGLQVGILFDILVWVMIATVFATLVFRQVGSLDVTAMKNLKEE